MNLIRVQDAAARYGKSKNTISSTACIFKRLHGCYPKWFFHRTGCRFGMVDTIEFERLGDIERKAWLFATDILYWAFEDLGINQLALSRLLSEKSERYKTSASWNSFMSNNLFGTPPEIILNYTKSMRIEFVQLGTRILYEMIKEGKIDGKRQA